MENELWRELCTQWQHEFGHFDDYAIREPRQVFRSGFALLLLNKGEPLTFLKLRHQGAAVLRYEYSVMKQIWRSKPRSFSIPKPLGFGSVGNWDYLSMAVLSSRKHRVSRNPPLAAITAEIGVALQALPRHSSLPDHWLPMHGDLTPWNLRELPDGELVIYDWEDAGWGPPDADDVLYRASLAAVRNTHPREHHAQEAVQYWYARVSGRESDNGRDRYLDQSLSGILRRMQNSEGPPHGAIVPKGPHHQQRSESDLQSRPRDES